MSDAYTKCRNCVNFGTGNCLESSLCFALNYKPFYKAKTKLKIKKKHRRAVCFAILVHPNVPEHNNRGCRGFDKMDSREHHRRCRLAQNKTESI